MGQSSSTKRSTPADTGSNLLWALEQFAGWEEKLMEDEQFLYEQISHAGHRPIAEEDIKKSTLLSHPIDTQKEALEKSSQSEIRPSPFHQPPPLLRRDEEVKVPIETSSSSISSASSEPPLSSLSSFSSPITIPTTTGVATSTVAISSSTEFILSSTTTSQLQLSVSDYQTEPSVASTMLAATHSVLTPVLTETELAGQDSKAETERPAEIYPIPGRAGSTEECLGKTVHAESASALGSSFERDVAPSSVTSPPLASSASLPSSSLASSSDSSSHAALTSNIAESKSSEHHDEHTMFSDITRTRIRLDDKLFLPQKFHFAYLALQRLVAGAERNFILHCRINMAKERTRNESQPLMKLTYEKKQESLSELLNAGLGAWDNAVAAVDWLRKDYYLAVRWVKLSRRLNDIHMEKEHLDPLLPTSADPDERKFKDREFRARTNALLTQTADLRKQLEYLAQEIALHQKESLSIGLLFLDRNMSGALEADDIPDVHADIFAALDVHGRHRITAKELQETVDAHLRDVVAREKELRDLELEINRDKETEELKELEFHSRPTQERDSTDLQKFKTALLRKQERYSLLYSQLQQKRYMLDRVYTLFGQAFIREVLKRLQTSPEEVVERVRGLLINKKQEERGISTAQREWQSPVDV